MNVTNNSTGLFFIARSAVFAIILACSVTACSTPSVSKGDVQTVAGLRKAAEQGDASAQFQLGGMYDKGEGVPLDYQQALAWYRKAADQGDAKAQYRLGQMFEKGRSAGRSKSALKRMLEKDNSVPQDYAQAMAWYRKAAEQGQVNAQYNLGVMYANDKMMGHDAAQSVVWYRKAAEQGHAGAQNNLGTMYYNGLGVTQDYSQALIWFQKAADQGDANAIKNVKIAKPKVKAAERQKYLESPEGKEEIKKAEAKSKADKKRIMLICDRVGKDAAKKYKFGKYDGTLTGSHVGGDIYYCVAIFKQKTVTGYMLPNHKGFMLNNRTGVYEIEYIN